MAHWQGHRSHFEEAKVRREKELRVLALQQIEDNLSKWFKRRRSFVRYCKRNVLYYIGGFSLMRGVEPLFNNVSPLDLLYQHAFVGNMVLIVVAMGLTAINVLFNKEE